MATHFRRVVVPADSAAAVEFLCSNLRIGEAWRGRGLGTAAVTWLTAHLFNSFASLHRIEATTREDNAAMRRVLVRCGYHLEGQLREAWRNADYSRADTMIYGILRTDVAATSARP